MPDVVGALRSLESGARDRPEAIRVVRAPGRVNLIGEHTDYNDGLVLPMAIDREIRIAYVPSDNRRVELRRLDGGDQRSFDLDQERSPDGTWLDYVAGTAFTLRDAGFRTLGLRGVIGTNLPENAGLSSSAAIELASSWAILGDQAKDIEPMALAQLCQRAENDYVGVRSGLMDQFAAACGVAGQVLLLDCRTLEWQPVRLPRDLSVVVCHTGSSRQLDATEYNTRRAQCEAAVQALAELDPSIRSLRDVSLEFLEAERHRLDPVVARRAEHVVRENDRVRATVNALATSDVATLRKTMAASHESLRRLYEVSSPELDALVEIAGRVPGVIAARMTGGGFGGCTINLVRPHVTDDLRDAVAKEYVGRTGLTATVFAVQAAPGARRLT